MDEELPRKKTETKIGAALDNASVSELEAYIEELEAEIKRVKAILVKRADVKNAAEAFFKNMDS